MNEGLELSLAAHSTRSVTLCLAAFSRLAFVEGDPHMAATLAGAAEGLRRRVGLRVWSLLGQEEAELVARVRKALGTDSFDQLYAAGSRLSQQEAGGAIRERPGRGKAAPGSVAAARSDTAGTGRRVPQFRPRPSRPRTLRRRPHWLVATWTLRASST